MAEWISGTLGFLERVPKIAFQFSATLIAIGGGLTLAFQLGFIRKDAINGYAMDVAGILLVVGLAILCLGIVFAGAGLIRKIPEWRGMKKSRKAQVGRLLENLRFLPPETLFVFLDILRQPSGRVPSVGDIPIMATMSKLSLIEPESVHSSVTDQGAMVQVNQLLLDDRENVVQYVKTLLVRRGNSIDALDNPSTVSTRANAALKAEIQEHLTYGGF